MNSMARLQPKIQAANSALPAQLGSAIAAANSQKTNCYGSVIKEGLGGVTSPQGFMAAGAHVGVKRKRKDLALIWSEVPAHAAAVFTTNVMKAAPILWNQKVVGDANVIRGIVINSGNANACTGETGMINAKDMATAYAKSMGVSPESIIIASTGVIGVQLPIQLIKQGIPQTTCQQLDGSLRSAGLERG